MGKRRRKDRAEKVETEALYEGIADLKRCYQVTAVRTGLQGQNKLRALGAFVDALIVPGGSDESWENVSHEVSNTLRNASPNARGSILVSFA